MESYQTLFPASSSSTMVINNSNNNYYNKGNNNGFLGLMSEMEINNNPGGGLSFMNNNNNNMMSLSNKSDNNGFVESDSKKIKGSSEKKKMKKPKYAFQTRSQVDILDDGYRWRKYGQKAVKNNKFPRSYYRCTHQGCNVKKQVQRLTKDEGVVVTTYEGMHSHSIEKTTDNFEHILSQMQIYTSY
ncbi:hypothetical protein Dsin_010713 [Dipteronia sinensis]|uniref:WRKY domain-containing protein n=1 Tax=Dipteronia sinensis TaxID=43782 RepID=A0AAE0ECU3_9ROSI|nr:hypothetical protein Dsin_010713 [Dipteronia sinensis]